MWIYEQASGWLLDPQGNRVGHGYSGRGEGKNNPAAEDVHNVGPIPCGDYAILSPRDTDTHGPFVLPLLPSAATRVRILSLGRDPDSFLIHGDSKSMPGTASQGCIIQAPDIRHQIWDSGDHDLKVVSGFVPFDLDSEIAT